MKINKTFIHTIKGIAIGLVLVAGISYVQAAWAPPAGAPSEENNAPAPINVSSSDQSKEGFLLVGQTGTPLVEIEVANSTATGTIWTDILQVWKTSQFLQKATFGSATNNGRIEVVDGSALGPATLNVNYSPGEAPLFGQAVNVDGSIVATSLDNEGPGFDITLKSAADEWYPSMLCADTNGKIVLCKDIDVPDVEVEDIPLSVSYTQSGLISEDSCTKSYTYTASATGADGSVFYEWRYSGYAADWTYYGSGSPITISFPKKVGSTYVTQVRLTGSSGDETNTAEALYSPITIPARPAGASC